MDSGDGDDRDRANDYEESDQEPLKDCSASNDQDRVAGFPGQTLSRDANVLQFVEVLDIPIRTVKIQVAAGRNLAVLVEAAVRNTILQLRGIDTLKDFIERQRNQMNLDSENNKSQGRLL